MESFAQEFADDATIASVVMIIFLMVGMTVFLYFFRTVGDLPHRPVDFGLQQRSMVKVCNPFVLELDQRTKDLKDVLRLNLSTLCRCQVVVVWGPNIQALHDFILLPGRCVRRRILTDVDETQLDPFHTDILQFDTGGKHSVVLACPDSVTCEALGEMPRSRYPCSVFVFTPEERANDTTHEPNDVDEGTRNNEFTPDDEGSNDNAIVGLIAVLHLKDSIVTKNSHIMAKYVKTAGIPIYSLQALFVSTDSQTQETSPSQQSAKPSTPSNLRHRKAPHQSTSQEVYSNRDISSSCKNNSSQEILLNPVCSKDQTLNCTDSDSRQSSCMNQDGCSSHCEDFELKTDMNDKDLMGGVDNCGEDIGKESQSGVGEEVNQQVDDVCDNHSGCSDGLGDMLKPLSQCIVCQSAPAKCALLPCRHNCVCLLCLRLLDKCPLCRDAMESYFIVSSGLEEEEDDWDIEEEDVLMEEIQRQGVAAHVENFLERVNHMVGFA